MADPTAVTLELVKNECTVPPPDDLIAGSLGATYTDIVKVSAQGEYKRGTLLMPGTGGYVSATQAGLTSATSFCILCDDVTIGANEYAEIAAYFGGEFNEERVIFPFETESDDHATIIESAREPLRKCGIFLRASHI
ncbi:MAG: hypothetical protein IJP89_02695 [Synergistaceae bacterium]|nr:hypothetical protein [Synergistaceae bacterium]